MCRSRRTEAQLDVVHRAMRSNERVATDMTVYCKMLEKEVAELNAKVGRQAGWLAARQVGWQVGRLVG